MKTKKSIVVTIGLLIGFVVGLMVGITLTNPGLSLIEAAGTIGKVDTYRNVKVTEEDIELRNELLADASLREAYKNYLMYEYAANIKMVDNIQYAITAVEGVSGFKTSNAGTLEKLEDYAMFLDNARLQILEAIGTLDDLSDRGQIAIRSILNSAGNAMAQTAYRSTVLFDFINDVERFINTSGTEQYPDLAKAHDLLFANLLNTCIVNDNRPVLEHLVEKELLSDGEELALLSEALQMAVIQDTEKLSLHGAEQLQSSILNAASLFGMLQGSEQLGNIGFYDAENLGMVLGMNSQTRLMGSEMLNSEQLRGSGMLDSEQLRGIVFGNAESLNLFYAKEQLGLIN
jgi:hypothetical protein